MNILVMVFVAETTVLSREEMLFCKNLVTSPKYLLISSLVSFRGPSSNHSCSSEIPPTVLSVIRERLLLSCCQISVNSPPTMISSPIMLIITAATRNMFLATNQLTTGSSRLEISRAIRMGTTMMVICDRAQKVANISPQTKKIRQATDAKIFKPKGR